VSEIVSLSSLQKIAADWMAKGDRVVGPVRVGGGTGSGTGSGTGVSPVNQNHGQDAHATSEHGQDAHATQDCIQYGVLADPSALVLDGFVRPANSIKEFVFPRHEALYGYALKGKEVELNEIQADIRPTLILAARPCDTAALAILDHIFNWDFVDESYNARRQAVTVVTLACAAHDEACFCTSVGLGPASEKGSDAMLFALPSGAYEVRTFNNKGKTVFDGRTQTSTDRAQTPEGPEAKFSVEEIAEFLKNRFEDPIWAERAIRCLGCAACAYTCPTCHCFDIVDERKGSRGTRARNWDACQFKMFTMHASGHNPRANQAQRQRQRIMHKFGVYPGKFGDVLCTGCGNCVRNCPVHLGVLGVLLHAAKSETVKT
jgi:sulfhydrogenase subunit beta (sulfur reductase)